MGLFDCTGRGGGRRQEMSSRSNQDKVNAMILRKNNMPTTSVPVLHCNRFQKE